MATVKITSYSTGKLLFKIWPREPTAGGIGSAGLPSDDPTKLLQHPTLLKLRTDVIAPTLD